MGGGRPPPLIGGDLLVLFLSLLLGPILGSLAHSCYLTEVGHFHRIQIFACVLRPLLVMLHYCVSVIMFMTLNDEEVLDIAQSYNKCELMMFV